MKATLLRIWRWVRWPLGVLLVAYIGLVIWRIPAVGEKQRTAEVVAQIHAQKITLADVLGTALPPAPNMQENNATVAGIDKNNNGVRDDVELAIFRNYPNSARIRAAELQYALTEQMFLTEVFNSDTWKAVAEENSRANACIGLTTPNFAVYIFRTKEVEYLVFNTDFRKSARDKAFDFIVSSGSAPGSSCDVDLDKLSN